MPRDWADAFAVLAHAFHFQPSELWMMDVEELEFWVDRLKWIKEQHG